MGRWQAKLEKRQAVLGRIVDIGAELFAISAAVVYASTIRAERPERAAEAEELADLFCKQARRRVGDLFRALWSNDDVDEPRARAARARGPLRVRRGGDRRPRGRLERPGSGPLRCGGDHPGQRDPRR